MDFLIIFVVTFVLCWVLRSQIHKYPAVFYALAVACNVALFACVFLPSCKFMFSALNPIMQRGGIGVALFLLVMWIGVLPRKSALSRGFRPIRAELSIMACIFIAGHMVIYLATYLPRVVAGAALKDTVMGAFIIACVLFALVLLLGVTSLRVVKRHMKARTWKRVQTLAYVFYALVLVHLLLMLGPSAAAGTPRGVMMVVIYVILFGGYIVARIVRAVVDRREHVDLAETIKDQGFTE